MDHLQISTLSIILRTYVFPFIINGFISFEHGQTTRFLRMISLQLFHLPLQSLLYGTEILGTSNVSIISSLGLVQDWFHIYTKLVLLNRIYKIVGPYYRNGAGKSGTRRLITISYGPYGIVHYTWSYYYIDFIGHKTN